MVIIFGLESRSVAWFIALSDQVVWWSKHPFLGNVKTVYFDKIIRENVTRYLCVFLALFDKLVWRRPFLGPNGPKYPFLTLFSLFLTPFFGVLSRFGRSGPDLHIRTPGFSPFGQTGLGLKKGSKKWSFLAVFWPIFGPLFYRSWAVLANSNVHCRRSEPGPFKRGQKGVPKMTHFWPLFEPFLDPFLTGPERFWLILSNTAVDISHNRSKGCQKGVPKMTLFWAIFEPFLTSKMAI
jgi:hypothetical protein